MMKNASEGNNGAVVNAAPMQKWHQSIHIGGFETLWEITRSFPAEIP
jgi:hypothetical protein